MFRKLCHLTTSHKFYLVTNYSKLAPKTRIARTSTINKLSKLDDIVLTSMDQLQIGKTQDWGLLRKSLLEKQNVRNLTETNLDCIVMSALVCLNRPDLAKSYIKYLNNAKTTPNLATLGNYLKLLYTNHKDSLTQSDETDIINLCNNIRLQYPVLESHSLQSVILVLSLTKQWRECLDLMEEIRKTASVSVLVYSVVAAAAFTNNEEKLAWELLWQAATEGKEPNSVSYLSYLKTLSDKKGLERLFLFLSETELHCPEDVVDFISYKFKLGQKTRVNLSGQCKSCRGKVEKLHLTDLEFANLKEAFLKNVIVGKDIFIKSNQVEMAKFQNFVSKLKPHDVVLDGLNIAYSNGVSKGPQMFSRNILAVVSHFVQQKKTVLVLGRVHMAKWPNWNQIKQQATVFLTQNISQDDPYLLYCALHCGKDTLIVTRDLMRSHKFLLKDHKLKCLFNRWLVQRQHFLLTVNDAGKAFFKYPSDFSDVAQNIGTGWHIPYIPAENSTINEHFYKTWFCLNK